MTAVTPVRGLVLNGKQLHALLDRVPSVRRRVFAELAARLRDADVKLATPRAVTTAARR